MAEEKSPYTVKTEGTIKYLIIDCRGSAYGPSIADYPQRMSEVIEYLGKTDADRLVLAEVYERVYDEDQTRMLKQIAELTQKLRVKGVWSPQYLGGEACEKYLPTRHDLVVNIASDLLRTDPIRAYMKCVEAINHEKTAMAQMPEPQKACTQTYITTLEYIKANMEATDLVQRLKNYVRKLKKLPPGRGFYHTVFEAQLKPSFIGSRLMFKLPEQIELIDQYDVRGTTVTVYKHPEKIEYLYHINPPEFALSPEHYFLLSKTKEIVSEYHPEGLEFTELATSKEYFMRVYETTIADIARQNGIEVTQDDIKTLARIVARYTIGFGMMGLLLSDQRLTDVYIDAPLGLKPVYVVHSDYGPCQTNVFFSEEEANSVISRFRSLSGRPFDEAHSVLDFDLHEYHTRTATIGPPLSPDGVAFALRIHKGTPWTLPQFIDVKMVTPEVAGLLSFLIDAQASSLIVGSRGSGKCLKGDSSVCLSNGEVKRIDELVEEAFSRAPTLKKGDEEHCLENPLNVCVQSLNLKTLKIENAEVKGFYRRKCDKIMRVKTASGRQVFVTREHPFFTTEDARIKQVFAANLKKGEFIAIPRKTLHAFTPQPLETIFETNLLAWGLKEFSVKARERLVRKYGSLKEAAVVYGVNDRTFCRWFRNHHFRLNTVKQICNDLGMGLPQVEFVTTTAGSKPVKLPAEVTPDLARLMGYVLGDGHLDKTSIIVTSLDEETKKDVKEIAGKVFKLPAKITPKNVVINSSAVTSVFASMGHRIRSRQRKVPDAIMRSPDKVVANFLKALFDCEAYVSTNHYIEYSTSSEVLATQLTSLLSRFAIHARLSKKFTSSGKGKPKRPTYPLYIYGVDELKKFSKEISFGLSRKQRVLDSIKTVSNTNVDILPNSSSLLRSLRKKLRVYGTDLDTKLYSYEKAEYNPPVKRLKTIATKLETRAHELDSTVTDFDGAMDYCAKANISQHELARTSGISQPLLSMHLTGKCNMSPLSQQKVVQGTNSLQCAVMESDFIKDLIALKRMVNSEIFWDRVVEVEELPFNDYVYDLETSHSNFIANNVIVHNSSMMMSLMLEILPSLRIITIEDTLEIPVEYMRKVGYNICRLKTRSAITVGAITSEVSPEDALRTALRLGDSVLIVGEVRSKEALVLYEAMRVGAVGNVVMGTIHAENAYSVWDRVVNDLGVPNTSFKATDMAIVAAPIRFKGSLQKARRLVEITEVGKTWYEDPGREEGGLIDLMTYDATTDMQTVHKDNIFEQSQFFKKIQKRRGMDIDTIWEDVQHRAYSKQFMVDMNNQYKIPDLLEARYTVRANDKYLLLQELSRQEIGTVDYPKVLDEWKQWVKDGFVKELVSRRDALAKVKPEAKES